jgi:hypothetical protein
MIFTLPINTKEAIGMIMTEEYLLAASDLGSDLV